MSLGLARSRRTLRCCCLLRTMSAARNSTRVSRNEAKKKRPRDWEGPSKTELHLGSYAHADQRALFGHPEPIANDNDTTPRAKRKVAMLLGYLGTDYGGFQMNAGQRTLQAELEWALYQSKLLHVRNLGFPHKYGWSTSGRTDKGVHACAQVVSCKLELAADQSLEDVRSQLDALLEPKHMRVLDVQRTTRAFCAHTQRDKVRYQYMLPSYALCEPTQLRKWLDAMEDCQGRPANDPLSQEQIQTMQHHFRGYRATPDQLNALKQALQKYEGTHSFHNLSKGVKNDEARAARYILEFHVQEPVIFGDVEWIPTHVLGQSFLLHQIRKMICLAVDVARGVAPMETMERALDRELDMRVNIAPAQGLFMEMAYYENYNRRKNDDLVALDWTVDGPAKQRWEDFRTVVRQHVAEEEAREGNFIKHLYIQEYIMDYRKYYLLDQAEGKSAAVDEAMDATADAASEKTEGGSSS